MSTSITWNGVSYSVPASGEVGWPALSSFLIALGNTAQATTFQKFGARIATTTPVTVVAATDCAVITNLGAAGAVAVNLPAGVDGQVFAVVDGKGDAHTNNITITPFGANTIDNAGSLVINSDYGAAIFIFKTTNWAVLSRPSVTLPAGAVTQDAVALWNADGSLRNSKLKVDDTGATAATATTFAIAQTGNRTVTVQDATDTLVGRATTDTLTNKTLTLPVIASISNSGTVTLPSGPETLVGRATTDTLTNKTLTSPAITTPTGLVKGDVGLGNVDNTSDATKNAASVTLTNKDIDGGTASNTSRITIPKAATATLAALIRKQGTLVYDTTLNQLKSDDGTNLNAIGGGSGELNYIANPNDAANWSTTGANGPTGATTSTAGDLPLSNFTTAIKLTSATAAGAEASNYFSYSFTTGASEAVKTKVEFWVRTGTNFLGSEWTVSVYAGATRQSLTTDSSAVTFIPAANNKFTTYFDAAASTAYTVRFARTVNAGTNAGVLNIANVIVGTGIQPQSAAVGRWVLFTPTGSWITNTVYSGAYRQVGSDMQVRVMVATSNTPTNVNLTVNMPTGFTIDTSVLFDVTASHYPDLGRATAWFTGAATQSYDAIVAYNTTTSVQLGLPGPAGSFNLSGQNLNVTQPNTFAAGDGVDMFWQVPIAEWAGSATTSLGQNTTEYVASTTGTWDAAAVGANSVYGPAGAPITGSLTAARTKVVTFSSPIQATDRVALQYQDGTSGAWVDQCDSPRPSTASASVAFGGYISAAPVGGTSATVTFNQFSLAGTIYNTTTGAVNWDSTTVPAWRVVKTSPGQAVGFAGATPTASGLAPAGIFAVGVPNVMQLQPASTPTNPSSSAEGNVYLKGGKLIFQYNDAGTVRWKYLDLTGTGVTWVHTTSAP